MAIVIVGGGLAGCAAALQVAAAGERAVLLERTDALPGTGQVGGIFYNNGRRTLLYELNALGGGQLPAFLQRHCRHAGVDFPGHRHADLMDMAAVAGELPAFLRSRGVEVHPECRVRQVLRDGDAVTGCRTDGGEEFPAAALIDATGSAGPQSCCVRDGNGCAMCVQRCPAFGGRISPGVLAGGREHPVRGRISGSCKLEPDSLAPALLERLRREGVVCLPLASPLPEEYLARKACRQYALPDFARQLVLLDTGFVKMMAPFLPLERLHAIPGLERARYADPYAGGRGNSVRLSAWIEREDSLRLPPLRNLFVAGERAGLLVGHTEAMCTGTLAGYNAVRAAAGQPPLTLPPTLAIGALLSAAREAPEQPLTASGGAFWAQMQRTGLYSAAEDEVTDRVRQAGLLGVFAGGCIPAASGV